MEPVTECYQKPFHLFHYNKPKQPDLPKIRKIPHKPQPKIPVRLNNATKMRNKAIRLYDVMEKEPYIDYRALTEETSQTFNETPKHVPRHTKTSQYRYKWIRDVPVVSCRFTEYVMMYKKPPFTFEKNASSCGHFRLRRMEVKSPVPEVIVEEKEEALLFPSILQWFRNVFVHYYGVLYIKFTYWSIKNYIVI